MSRKDAETRKSGVEGGTYIEMGFATDEQLLREEIREIMQNMRAWEQYIPNPEPIRYTFKVSASNPSLRFRKINAPPMLTDADV